VIDAVHQFVPVLEPGAVGVHTIELQRLLREMGLRSEVYAERSEGAFAGRAHPFRSYGRLPRRRSGDVLLYQSAIGAWIGAYVLRRPEPLVVNYHNITPASYFRGWELGPAHGLGWGRGQLKDMAARAALGVADSRFNELELEELGYRETAVSPVLFDLAALDRAVDEAALAQLQAAKRDGGADWLFVGRVAPHKAQHDLIRALAAYRRMYDPRARLHIVGGSSSDRYVDALRSTARDLDVASAVDITGGVPDGVLAAHYRAADVFVCLSEHEGFCIPLIEAMHHRVPVVAFAAAAVPETLGPAGILLRTKEPARVAAAVERAVRDATVREQLQAAAAERLGLFSLERSRESFRAVIERVVRELS
jgi:glycosyltransferase involved in cell wall biosynthesis